MGTHLFVWFAAEVGISVGMVHRGGHGVACPILEQSVRSKIADHLHHPRVSRAFYLEL